MIHGGSEHLCQLHCKSKGVVCEKFSYDVGTSQCHINGIFWRQTYVLDTCSSPPLSSEPIIQVWSSSSFQSSENVKLMTQ